MTHVQVTAVKHKLSFDITDCAQKVNQKIFQDSNISKNISCCRIKSEAIVNYVLAPTAVEDVMKILTFSSQNDASNKGYSKKAPTCSAALHT